MSHFSFFDSLCDLHGSLTPLKLCFISRVNKGSRLVIIQESYRMERRKKFIPLLPLHLLASDAAGISQSWRQKSPASARGPAHIDEKACPQHGPSHGAFLLPHLSWPSSL